MTPPVLTHALAHAARMVGATLFTLLACAMQAGQARAESITVSAPASGAPADPPPGIALAADVEQQVRALALGAGAALPPGVSRVEVVVGQLDPRLRLAPCQTVEPYLPSGTRLWGRSRIGLRCAQGPALWNVYLPITVKAWGPGLVATASALSASTLQDGDVALGEVDLAAESTPALVDPAQAVGRTLAQSVKPGQSLRQGHLKLRQWFLAGDTVKVLAVGSGFQLEGEGQALSNGIEGQPARVRTEGGRVLTGSPVASRRMELAF